jgi:negative regulator of replication initiation
MAERVDPSLVALAARARAAGMEWQDVARVVDRHERSVRRWPKRYAKDWSNATANNVAQAMAEAIDEAIKSLRTLLRNDEVPARLNAAKALLSKLYAVSGESETEADDNSLVAKFLHYVESLDHDSPHPIDEAIDISVDSPVGALGDQDESGAA